LMRGKMYLHKLHPQAEWVSWLWNKATRR